MERAHEKYSIQSIQNSQILFDIHLALVTDLKPRRFFICPSSFTAYIILLFTDLVSPPSERHNNSWKGPASCDQIHPKWLHIWLQISSNCSQDSIPLMMQLELYDVMFFIRSLKGPTDTFNIDDHAPSILHGSTHSSTHLKLKHVLSRTLQDIFTSTEFLDCRAFYLPLT